MTGRPKEPRADAADTKRRADHRRSLIDQAAAGDAMAGRAMLQHAMAAIRGSVDRLDESEAVALTWLANGLASFLSGVPLDRALCVEVTGRPGTPPMARFVFEVWPIFEEVRSLSEQLASQGVARPKATAVNRVAQRLGISESKVRAAVTEAKKVADSAVSRTEAAYAVSAGIQSADDPAAAK